MARGVISALQAQGLADSSKVFVAGSDADLANLQFVEQGKETVEIWKKVKPLAEKAAEIAVLLAQSPDTPVSELVKADKTINNGAVDVPTIVTPIVAVTKDNLKDTVIAEGLYTEAQISGK
jgi:D-xylose transport system substrate-binding protein